jgi:hypothetical protein
VDGRRTQSRTVFIYSILSRILRVNKLDRGSDSLHCQSAFVTKYRCKYFTGTTLDRLKDVVAKLCEKWEAKPNDRRSLLRCEAAHARRSQLNDGHGSRTPSFRLPVTRSARSRGNSQVAGAVQAGTAGAAATSSCLSKASWVFPSRRPHRPRLRPGQDNGMRVAGPLLERVPRPAGPSLPSPYPGRCRRGAWLEYYCTT